MDIKIDTTGIDKLSKSLRNMERKQIPAAIGYALSYTANDVRKEVIREATNTFTIRTGWLKTGQFGFITGSGRSKWRPIKISQGSIIKDLKTTGSAFDYVSSNADWLPAHVEGGIKKRSGQLAIPQPAVKKSATAKTIMTVARKAPLREPKFVGPVQSKRSGYRKSGGKVGSIFTMKMANKTVIAVRKSKKKITPLFDLVKQARIKKRFDFYRIATKEAQGKFQFNFARGFAYAMKTAKK